MTLPHLQLKVNDLEAYLKKYSLSFGHTQIYVSVKDFLDLHKYWEEFINQFKAHLAKDS